MTRPIRVALETQFADARPTGIGIYARRLADALRARGDIEVIELRDPRFDLWRFDRRVFWDQVRAPQLARAAGADVYHFTGGTLPLRPPRPTVLTLHDLVWLRGANRGRPYVRWYFGRFQGRLARRADVLVVDTDAARRDVADGLGIDPVKIHVAGAGVDERFFNLERRPTSPPFVLCVGTIEERKDLATAVRALARVPRLRLVAVGPRTPYARFVEREAARFGVADRVELRGYVDDAALMELYATATALVSASKYEGFGLPPLQALACGLPVVAARIPVAEEVLGDCAFYFEPGDDARLGAALHGASAGDDVDAPRIAAAPQRARRYTWDAVAAKMVDVYGTLVQR